MQNDTEILLLLKRLGIEVEKCINHESLDLRMLTGLIQQKGLISSEEANRFTAIL